MLDSRGSLRHSLPLHPSKHYYDANNGVAIPRLQAVLESSQSWETLPLTFVDLGQVPSELQFSHH